MLDIKIFFILNSLAHQSIFLNWLIYYGANLFGQIMIVLAFLFLLFHTDGKFDYRTPLLQLKNKIVEIFFVFSSAFFAWIIASLLKKIIISPRPFIFFENLKPVFLHGGMDSFPSGHAVFFGALATSLFFIHRRMGYYYIFVALIVGLSRIIAGIHFPSDIFFGYIFGILIALFIRFLYKKTFKII